jgi:hypothetical protein
MSIVKCPKCGKVQPLENSECSKCGVVFKKLLKQDTPAHVTPEFIPDAPSFLPPIGLKKNLEITILNVFAYVYLILGIGYGIGIIIELNNELALIIGFSVIIGALITSMLFFVFCTIAKKIISIDVRLEHLLLSKKL